MDTDELGLEKETVQEQDIVFRSKPPAFTGKISVHLCLSVVSNAVFQLKQKTPSGEPEGVCIF